MTGDRQKIEWDFLRVDFYFAERLNSVRMKNRADRLGQRRQFGDRLDGPDFVVDPHHCADGGVSAHQCARRVHSDGAGRVDGEKAFFGAFVRGLMDRLQYCFVFDR